MSLQSEKESEHEAACSRAWWPAVSDLTPERGAWDTFFSPVLLASILPGILAGMPDVAFTLQTITHCPLVS